LNDPLLAERRARARLDEVLTSRQMVFVTGKGGVGKSVVSAALALRARALGLRPVLFECDAPSRISLLPHARAAGSEVGEIANGILGINQRSDDAIRDYAASTLPSRTVADLLFENRVARTFLQASPSVSEMALIGRIASVAEEFGADGPVIVDLHATGHAIGLLRAPAGIMKVLQRGVLFERAQRIEEMLQDANRTAFVTVAVPEELPVTELLELHDKLKELRAPVGPVILNAFLEDPGQTDPLGLAPPALGPAALAALLADSQVGGAAGDFGFLRLWATRCAREKTRLLDGLHATHGQANVVTFRHLVTEDSTGIFGPEELLAVRLANDLARPLIRPSAPSSGGAAAGGTSSGGAA
jgi:anion-transporting  ArsA/GET3 family ATPase